MALMGLGGEQQDGSPKPVNPSSLRAISIGHKSVAHLKAEREQTTQSRDEILCNTEESVLSVYS